MPEPILHIPSLSTPASLEKEKGEEREIRPSLIERAEKEFPPRLRAAQGWRW